MDWALKYRPRVLDDLVGQDVNKEILKELVAKDSLFGAMIFYGRSGCGKTTTARILVNELDAEIIELDGASNNGVDDARNIKDIASKLALTGKRKIIIIDEAHMLSRGAWNALLKAIEEPNSMTHFIFCTTEYRAIPTTIRGRSHMFKFYSIEPEVLTNYAKHILRLENSTIADEVLELVVRESQGQVRDMLKLLQIAVQHNLNTREKLEKFLALPGVGGMGSFLEGVLSGNSKLATRALKTVTTDLLEWRDRLESLIYEMLEDYYNLSELPYTLTQTAKLRELTRLYPPVLFGKILDYLLRITRAETARQMFYVLATLGVANVN